MVFIPAVGFSLHVRIENSFIPASGVGEKTEQKLWQHGITHWEDFSGDVVGPTRAQNINAYIDQASQHLDRENPDFFCQSVPDSEHWRLYENFRSNTAFIDIETTGLDQQNNTVTTVSIHQDGSTETLVQGHDLTADQLQARIDNACLLVTFNGSRFDLPFLRKSFDVTFERPHVDLMFLARRVGYSCTLSELEQQFGISRDSPDISGKDAVRLWYEYQSGKDGSLETLIKYNQEDTVNMKPLMDAVTTELHQSLFVNAIE